MTSIEGRIRWSGAMVLAGLSILLISLLWAHPLAFMAFLVAGCPLILAGVLLYLWSLAAKDGAGSSSLLPMLLMALSFLIAGCGSSDPLRTVKEPAASLPAFDPSTATAKVSGRLIFDGKPPAMGSISIARDVFCQKNGQDILKEEQQVTADGSVRNVIVYVRSGLESRSYEVPQQPVVLDQQKCIYIPRVFTIMKGQKLRILNGDPTFHNVHAEVGGDTIFNIAQAAQGAEDIQSFSKAAMPLRIGCDFHSWMNAYAGVFEHPFHTSSGNTGNYELRLPPGKYEIVAWHQKYGEKVASVEVSSGATVQQDFKFSQVAAQ